MVRSRQSSGVRSQEPIVHSPLLFATDHGLVTTDSAAFDGLRGRSGMLPGGGVMAAQPRRTVPRTYSKHGLTTLKQAVNGLGGRVIDMRTALGKALAQWRGDLVADLSGAGTRSRRSKRR